MNKFRFFFNLLLVVLTTSFISGCSDEAVIKLPKVRPQIELLIPDIEEVFVYSDATERENFIESCFVLTFSNSGTFKESEQIDIGRIYRNGQATVLLPTLDIEMSVNDRIYVICNIDTTANLDMTGKLYTDINTVFYPEKDYYFGGEALPMSGSLIWSETNYTITMTRAVAKVTVQLGETFTVGVPDYVENKSHWGYWDIKNFDVSKVGFIIGNYGGASNIIQNPSVLSNNLAQQSDPFYATTLEAHVTRFIQYAQKEREMSLYISEYPTSTTTSDGQGTQDNEWHAQRQYILMMPNIFEDTDGIYYHDVNLENEFLAWRLDFYDVRNKKYLDIKRNHHYTFVVNRIGSLPYAAPDGGYKIDDFGSDISAGDVHNAIVNHGSNIEYDVYVTESWAHKNYSNGQYGLSISVDTIKDLTVPFLLKIDIPVEYAPGIPVGNNNPSHNAVYFYDHTGSPMVSTSLEITDNYPSWFLPGTYPPYPINPSGMEFHFRNPDSQFLVNGGYLEIYYGNIYKRVPFKF